MKEIADKVFGMTPKTLFSMIGTLFLIAFAWFNVNAKTNDNTEWIDKHEIERDVILDKYEIDMKAISKTFEELKMNQVRIITILEGSDIEYVTFD